MEKEVEKLIASKFGTCYKWVGNEHHIKKDFLEFTITMAIE